MKKYAICLIISCIALATQAQISISKADMPVAGDTFRFATVQPIGSTLNLNQTGANQTWNFKNLKLNTEELVEYKASSKTPYAFYFFNTYGNLVADNIGFGQFALTQVYNFYRATNTDFTAEGIGFKFNNIPLGGFYTDKDEIYKFPLSYTDVDKTQFKVTVQIPTVGSYKQSGSRENTVDGWGKITTPYKTYDCIRVKSIVEQVDSIFILQPFAAAFGFPSTRVEYKWLTKVDRVPVFEVSGTDVAGNFVPTVIRYRYDRKAGSGGGVGVQEIASTNKITVYPNPASDKLLVNIANNGESNVKLFTMEGKEITAHFIRTDAGIEINTDTLATGFYMLFAKSGNEMVWEKVQISR